MQYVLLLKKKKFRSPRYDYKFWNLTLPEVDLKKHDIFIESWQKWKNAEFNDCVRRLMRPRECSIPNDETLVKYCLL